MSPYFTQELLLTTEPLIQSEPAFLENAFRMSGAVRRVAYCVRYTHHIYIEFYVVATLITFYL